MRDKSVSTKFRFLRTDLDEKHSLWVPFPRLQRTIREAYEDGQIGCYTERGGLGEPRAVLPQVKAAVICDMRKELPGGKTVFARGFSFCSAADQFERGRGCRIAAGRAEKRLRELVAEAQGDDVGAGV